MKRFPHYLRPVKGNHWPQCILCVDVVGDTFTENHNPRMLKEVLNSWSSSVLERNGDDYNIRFHVCGQSVSGFWETLYKASQYASSLWVMSYRATRLWNLLALWEEIENGRIIIAERPNATAIRECILYGMRGPDSTSPQWPVSASSMSRLLGNAIGYLVSADPPNIIKARFQTLKQWFTWVDMRNYGVDRPSDIADGSSGCNWLAAGARSITAAVNAAKLGSLRPTAGSQAMHGFRTSYYKGGIYVATGFDWTAIETAGYYGGRCECRTIGVVKQTVVCGDFSSQYCRLCRDQELPIRFLSYQRATKDDTVGPVGLYGQSIATVDIETDEPAYPYRRPANPVYGGRAENDPALTPARYADTDIIYPIGRFTTTLCGPELQDAVSHGRVKKWHCWAVYELQPALREYATAILQLRGRAERFGDAVGVQLAKRLGNSLPGKFGERHQDWTYAPEASCDVQYGEWYAPDSTGELQRYRAIAGVTYRLGKLEYSQEAVPAIAAWVTSLGRMALLETIRLAGWNNVYYYDTDSIFTNSNGWENLRGWCGAFIAGQSILRKIGESDDAEFHGIKHYRFGGKYVCAGMSGSGVILPISGPAYQRTPTPTEMVRAGQRPVQIVQTVSGERAALYRHGTVGVDGKVSPIVLQEWKAM